MDCTFNFIMDSESDAEEYTSADNQIDNKLIFLAVNLKNYPEYLDKSQKPEAKKKKEAAMKSLLKTYQEKFGHAITAKQMLKTINNMKSRLKKKTAESQRGNKRIRLNPWEKIMYDLLEGDMRPSFTETPSTLDITTCFKLEDESTLPSEGMNALTSTDEGVEEFVTPHNKKLKTEQYETEESRGLTTEELQRVVLIEQLAAARAQKEFYREMLAQKRKARMNCSQNFPL